MTDHPNEHAKLHDLVSSERLAMLTTVDPDGRLVSHPMATQEAEFDGTVWFIAERSSGKVQNILRDPRVNVAYSGSSAWVSLSGDAEVLDDQGRLEEYWNTFTDAWTEGGPDNPENILIKVTGTSAEYWDTPNSKVVQVVNLVKSTVTGERYAGDNERVDLEH